MAIKVMIHVDALKRDTLTAWVLAILLKEKKYEAILCGRSTYSLYYNAFKPDIVIQPYSWAGGNTPEVLAERAKQTKFVVLYSEATNIFKRGFLSKVLGPETLKCNSNHRIDKYAKHITRVFTWGRLTRQWLLEEDILKPEQVKVVGNPRFDEYSATDSNIKKEGIGVISRFSWLNPFDGRSILSSIYSLRNYKHVYYDSDRNLEDLFWYNFASIRIIFELLDKTIFEKGRKVFYRPHPNERVTGYRYFEKKYGKNFALDNNVPFSIWLSKINALIVNSSTSIVEGFINNVPVISIHGLMGDRLSEHIKEFPTDVYLPFLKFCYMPKTMDECMGLIEKAYRGELEPAKISDSLKKVLFDFCDWPRKEPSLITICNEIDKIAELVRAERKIRRSMRVNVSFLAPVKLSLNFLRRLISYFRNPTLFEIDREYNYLFWHRRRYIEMAKKIVMRLKNKGGIFDERKYKD